MHSTQGDWIKRINDSIWIPKTLHWDADHVTGLYEGDDMSPLNKDDINIDSSDIKVFLEEEEFKLLYVWSFSTIFSIC